MDQRYLIYIIKQGKKHMDKMKQEQDALWEALEFFNERLEEQEKTIKEELIGFLSKSAIVFHGHKEIGRL